MVARAKAEQAYYNRSCVRELRYSILKGIIYSLMEFRIFQNSSPYQTCVFKYHAEFQRMQGSENKLNEKPRCDLKSKTSSFSKWL